MGNVIFDVQAEYVGAAAIFANEDKNAETINKVYIIPALNGGAIIWSMDGFQAFFAYDESATVQKPCSIMIHKGAMKQCGKTVDSLKKRLQAIEDIDALRIVTNKKSGEAEYVDFSPAHIGGIGHMLSYEKFMHKGIGAKDGVKSRMLNGSNFATMKRIFKEEKSFKPIVRQGEDNDSPIFVTFQDVQSIVIAVMPMQDYYEEQYAAYSDTLNHCISSPYAVNKTRQKVDLGPQGIPNNIPEEASTQLQ